jgi:hypothetical protein
MAFLFLGSGNGSSGKRAATTNNMIFDDMETTSDDTQEVPATGTDEAELPAGGGMDDSDGDSADDADSAVSGAGDE